MTDDDRDRCECCNMVISSWRGACPDCGCCDMCCDCKLPDEPADMISRARAANIEVREIGRDDAKGEA